MAQRYLTAAAADKAACAKFFEAQASDNHAWRGRFRLAFFEALHHELTTRQFEALRLYYVEGRSGREIALLWNVSPSAVSRHLSRAQNRLRSLLAYNLEWREIQNDV